MPLVKLKPIGRQVLSEEVLHSLREAILEGVYSPGERLVEREVARNLGVSQGPVREALRKLELEGLVRTFPHQGTYVASIDEKDILEILDVRTALERLAVRTIISHGDGVDLSPLFEIYQQMLDTARHGDWDGHIERDLAFHQKICELSENHRLLEIWMLMSGQFRLMLAVQCKAVPHALEEIALSHQVLLNALTDKDVQAAEAFFRYNYGVFEPVMAYMSRRPQTDS